MTRAFLRTGGDQFDALWRVVLSVPKSQLNWVYEVFYGMLVNGADENAWMTAGETSPAEAAAIFEEILRTIVMLPSRIGEIFAYVSVTPPDHCLLCDGALHDKADYPELAALLAGTALDINSTQFRTPSSNGRFWRGTTVQGTIGITTAVTDVTLTNANLSVHSHSVHQHGIPVLVAPGALPVDTANIIPGATGNTGSATPFPIIPLNVRAAYMIVAEDP